MNINTADPRYQLASCVVLALALSVVISGQWAIRWVRTGRRKNRYTAFTSAMVLFVPLSGVIVGAMYGAIVGAPRLWLTLPKNFTEPAGTVLIIVGYVVTGILFTLLVVSGIIVFWTSTEKPGATRTAATKQILNRLEQQAGAGNKSEVALTVDLLRTELAKQDRSLFRQNLAFNVVFFAVGVFVSIAIQHWVR